MLKINLTIVKHFTIKKCEWMIKKNMLRILESILILLIKKIKENELMKWLCNDLIDNEKSQHIDEINELTVT